MISRIDFTIESWRCSRNESRDYLSLIFIARHLERVGDHAKNIAEDAVYAAEAEDDPAYRQHLLIH